MTDEAPVPGTDGDATDVERARIEGKNLVEPEGVNAGSSDERDRHPSTVPPSDGVGGTDRPERDAPPPTQAVGLPDQPFGTPGQQLEAGEG